jgi:hypothetical protein
MIWETLSINKEVEIQLPILVDNMSLIRVVLIIASCALAQANGEWNVDHVKSNELTLSLALSAAQ